MKTKKGLIAIILIAFTLVAAVTTIFFVQEDTDSLINTGEPVTEVSSKTETEEVVVVEKVESETVSSKEEKFIEPDETKADEILKNHSSKPKEEKKVESKKEETTSSKSSSSKKVDTSSKKTESKSKDEDTQTLEEGQKELENTANDYLKKHNIDPKTAGETGELCPNCNKKIWNPDKYGFFIPGMPEDYENSGYCLGTCAIVLE